MKLNHRILLLFIIIVFSSNVLSNDIKQLPNNPDKEKFMFLINSDPQMGDEHTTNPGLQILNELLEMFVSETNKREKKNKPDFVVWNGDLVWKPAQIAFDNFERIVSKMKAPSVLVHGNHDGVNDDPKFLNLQEKLSGYRKLNYSFDYGQWHFVIIAAPEKYLKKTEKMQLLNWLNNDLKENKDKKTMLFMHYHILPTGLSQTEFYTYFPMTFKNKLLDTITKYNNVKYVFSGHVHIGIKASIKSARTYRGTNFILSPTPVFARPFGEEFPEYNKKDNRLNNRGFYVEVHVEADKVKLVGRKIQNPFKVEYPTTFKPFTRSEDERSFIPEGLLPVNDHLLNGSFDDGLDHWNSSWRYQTDEKPAYRNSAVNGKSILKYIAKYGSWNYDEYMENYQIVKYFDGMHLSFDFKTLPNTIEGGGGYFRIFSYNKSGKLLKILLFHWGTGEEKVNYMHQSWAYNATGNRKHPLWLNMEIQKGNLLSYSMNIEPLKNNILDIQVSELFNSLENTSHKDEIHHISIAYGVWGRVDKSANNYTSMLNVEDISISKSEDKKEYLAPIMINNTQISESEKNVGYGEVFTKMQLNKRKRTKPAH